MHFVCALNKTSQGNNAELNYIYIKLLKSILKPIIFGVILLDQPQETIPILY